MPSGNFTVGKDLPLEGFRQYVEPVLAEKGYAVMDRLEVPGKEYRTILVSLAGDGDMRTGVNDALVNAGEKIEIEQEAKIREPGYKLSAWTHMVSTFSHRDGDALVIKGIFEVVGLYSDTDTASQLFPALAKAYLLNDLVERIEQVGEAFREFVDKPLRDM